MAYQQRYYEEKGYKICFVISKGNYLKKKKIRKKNAGGTETGIFLEHKKNQIHCISQEELQQQLEKMIEQMKEILERLKS